MEYEFELQIDEAILINGTTSIQLTKIQGHSKVKFGITGPLEAWRNEVPYKDDLESQ